MERQARNARLVRVAAVAVGMAAAEAVIAAITAVINMILMVEAIAGRVIVAGWQTLAVASVVDVLQCRRAICRQSATC